MECAGKQCRTFRDEDHDCLVRLDKTVDLLRHELLGNGQPGRCISHGRRIGRLELWMSRVNGAIAILGVAVMVLATIAGVVYAAVKHG